MTSKVIRGQGQGHVRQSFQNDDFQNLSPPPFFNQSKKFQWFLILDKVSRAGFLNFLLVIESRDFWLQSLPQNRLRPILMKLGLMLVVDETFTTIWLSRSSKVRVKVRRWPHSPFGTIFCPCDWHCTVDGEYTGRPWSAWTAARLSKYCNHWQFDLQTASCLALTESCTSVKHQRMVTSYLKCILYKNDRPLNDTVVFMKSIFF